MMTNRQAASLRKLIAEKGLDENDPKSLEALWPHLSIVIREACRLTAFERGLTPQSLGAEVVKNLLNHYDAESEDAG